MNPFNTLLQKYIEDRLTRDELEEFLRLIRDPANTVLLDTELKDKLESSALADLSSGIDIDAQFRAVLQKAANKNSSPGAAPAVVKRISAPYKWMVAASVAVILLVTGWWMVTTRPEQLVNVTPPDIAPGTSGAILTLADGTRVVLDSLNNGLIATQSGTKVRLEDGRLTYLPASAGEDAAAYNTMSTPKGRQFQLKLPDGTMVWLNAASSIQYPVTFIKGERRVLVTGEAYFEVAQDIKSPFIVEVNNETEIQVLGTSFNVNGYMDEGASITTLLQGAVKVSGKQAVGKVLKPGEQALLKSVSGNTQLIVQEADTEKVMAWKNGFFNFEGAGLKEVMKQLERWYDINVVYENGVPDVRFFGEMSRNVNLAELISALQEMKLGVNIRLDSGRRLVISP